MKVFGHRGASALAPENTLKAFDLAHRHGAHGIELDVQLTSDGEAVVIHDFNLERVSNGSGAVASKTLAELKTLDFKGEKIPTLDEALDFIAGTEMLLNIEIKSIPSIFDVALIKLTAKKIMRSGLTERVIVSSFDHRTAADIKKEIPAVKTGILYSCLMVNVWDYAKSLGAEFIHPYHESLIAETVTGCHANGIGINTWTVDRPEDVARMRQIGVDTVISNNPGEVLRLLAKP